MFQAVVWQHMQGVVGFMVNINCKITEKSSSEKVSKKVTFDRIFTLSCGLTFSAHTVVELLASALLNDRD